MMIEYLKPPNNNTKLFIIKYKNLGLDFNNIPNFMYCIDMYW